MSEWDGPRRARPDEFGEAMRFTDLVFRPGQKGRRILQRQYPHAYRDDAPHTRRLLILRHEGDLVGCVAVHPMTLRLGVARVSAGGIGIVGTHPERRGEGIMTRLLHEAIRRMRSAGHAVSVLGGDRQRYGRFGWENAGVRILYHITARSLGKPTAAERGLRLRRLRKNSDAAVCNRVRKLSGARSFGVVRPLGDVRPLLVRNGKETWFCQAGRRFAYVVAGGAERQNRPYASICEFGGDPELTLALFRRLLPRAQSGVLSVVAGPNADEQALLGPVSTGWFRMADGMTQILDVARVAQQVLPELRRRASAHRVGGRFELQVDGVDGTRQHGTLELGGHGRTHRLRLDPRELVELLFGCLPVDERFGAHAGISDSARRTLAVILPLPLHIPPLNHI
jgi:predicted N-acetyltransferase YhbS